MLNLLSINPTGLFSFGKSGTLDLSDGGLIHLVGVNEDKGGCSNGSGKSSLFNSICETLWGQNPTGVKGKGAVNQTWQEGCASRVEFLTNENIKHRVTYCRNWKDVTYYPVDADTQVEYTGTSLFFEKFQLGQWVDLRAASIADTRKLIEQVLGLSYEQFLAIAHLSPRVGNSFLRGTNKERISIVSEIAGLEEWEQMLVLVREERKKFDHQVKDLDQKTAYEKGVLATLQQQKLALDADNWQDRLFQYNQQLIPLCSAESAYKISIESVTQEINQLSSSMQPTFDFNSLYKEIKALQGAISQLYSNSEVRRKADEEYSKVMKPYELEISAVMNRLSESKGLVSVLEKNSTLASIDKCPTCGSKISKTKKDAILKELEDAKTALKLVSEEYTNKQATTVEYKAKAEKAKEAVFDKLKEHETKLRDEIRVKEEAYSAKKKEHDDKIAGTTIKVKEKQIELQKLNAEASRTAQEVANLRHWVQQCETNIKALEGIVGSIRGQEEKLSGLETKRLAVLSECEVYDWLIKNIPFIKLHKLAMYMVILSNKANEYLAAMGDTIRIHVDAFSEKTSKKNASDMADLLKSEINVMITDGSKLIDAGLYSDGETSRITNAIIRALHDLSATSGRGCNLVFLDEIFSFVDGDNAEKLANSILPKDAATIIVTDNSGKVDNYVTFNTKWVVRKTNNLTKIEV